MRRAMGALLCTALATLLLRAGIAVNEPAMMVSGVLLCLPAAELWK